MKHNKRYFGPSSLSFQYFQQWLSPGTVSAAAAAITAGRKVARAAPSNPDGHRQMFA